MTNISPIFLFVLFLLSDVHAQSSVPSCSSKLSIGVDFTHEGFLTITPSITDNTASITSCRISLTSAYGSTLNTALVSAVTSCTAASSFSPSDYGGDTFALGTQFEIKFSASDADSNLICESTKSFTADACKESSTNTASSLVLQWRADGSLVVTVSNPPSSYPDSQCRITLSTYSGTVLTSPVITQSCAGPTSIAIPAGATFLPGTSNEFSYKVFDASTPSNTVCVIAPTSVSFTKCSGSTSVGLLKYPFSRVLVTPSGFASSTNTCVFRSLSWGGSNGAYTSIPCGSSSLISGSDHGTFSGLLAEFDPAKSDYGNAQPLCVTDISTISVNNCNSGTAPISLQYKPFTSIRAKYGYDMSPKKCALFVKKWNKFTSSDSSTDVVYFEDSACALNGYKEISLSDMEAQLTTSPEFSFSGTYQIEYAAYDSFSSAGASLTTNPSCSSAAVSLTLDLVSCSTKLAFVVDFTTTGTFTLTPTVIDSSVSITNCQFQITKANGATLTNPVVLAATSCGTPTTVLVADYGGSFTPDTDFEFVFTGMTATGTVVCQSTRVVKTSRCKSSSNAITNLYGWSKTSATLYVGQTNQPVATGSASCAIEALSYGGVATYTKVTCDSSLITSIAKPSSVTVSDSTFSYHLQLLDASSNILCSTQLHTLSNTACKDGSAQSISTSSTEYQGDGTIHVTLSDVTTGTCSVAAVSSTSGYVGKTCGSGTISFYSSDFTTSTPFGNVYDFLLLNTATGDLSTQTCATVVTVTPQKCTGSADLGISFDSSGVFTIVPRNVDSSVNSCQILMSGYDADTNLRVKKASASCNSTITFSKADSVSKNFNYGGTFSFSILGYDSNGLQTCSSGNNQVIECSVSPNRALVVPEYTGDGDFYVSGVNFPGMDVNQQCQYELIMYAGSSLLEAGKTVIQVACDNSIKGLFIQGITSGLSGPFAYEKDYIFRRRVILNGNPVCYSATTLVTANRCQDTDFVNTSLRYWHDTVNYLSVFSNVPSVTATDNCQVTIIQGSVRKVTTGACTSFLSSTASISASGFSSATATALKFSLQVFASSGLQTCSVGGSSLLSCSNDATGASFGIGSDFSGSFYVGISKTAIGVVNGNKCRVEMIRINGNVVPSAFVQKAVNDCDGTTVVASDYNAAISNAVLIADSLLDFRVVRLDDSNVPICYSPIRTFTYTQCSSTKALGWIDSGDLVVTYKDLPNVASGVYAGMTCAIQSLQLLSTYGYNTASCASVARFTNAAYTADKNFLYHIQVSSSSPSVVQCGTPTYTLVDSSCTSLTLGTAFDDTGIFSLTLSTSDSANTPCEFLYMKNELAGNLAPFQAVTDCAAATFTDTTNFQFDKKFVFKYRRITGSTESCSLPATIIPKKCVSATSPSTYSSLSASHTASGVFSIVLWNPPSYDATGTTCVYSSSTFSDAKPDCSLNIASIDASATYKVGQTYKFRFAYFPSNSAVQSCTTPTITYTDCSTAVSVYGWYSGYGDFALSATSGPTLSGTDKCRYEFLEYNGGNLDVVAGLPYVDSADCSGAKFMRGSPTTTYNFDTFSLGTDFKYRLRVVSSDGTTTKCYSATTSGTTAQCSPTVTVSLTKFDVSRQFTVAVAGGPDPAVDECQVALLYYGVSKVGYLAGGTGSCVGASFTYANAGLASAPAKGGSYRFGFLNYSPITYVQTCASATLTVTDCNSSGDIAVQYNGIGDLIVQSKDVPSGGTCTIQLLKYADSSVDISSASCGSSSFTQSSVGKTFSFGSDFVFKQNVVPTSGTCESPQVTVTSAQCSSSSGATTLSIEWRADGRILATVVNQPTIPKTVASANARISLYSYSGLVLSSLVTQTGFGQVTFNKPTGSLFVAGSVNTLLFSAVDGSSPASTDCAISPTTVTFTQCSGGASVALLRYPFSRIMITPSNIPRGDSSDDKCVFRSYAWGSGSSSYIDVSCDSPTLITVTGYGEFSGVIATYNSGVSSANYGNTQPNCVTPFVSITVPKCTTVPPISVYTIPFDTVRVKYLYDMSPMDCALFVKRWNTYSADLTSSDVVVFEDPSCALSTTYSITNSAFAAKLGSATTFSLSGPYEIEYAAYSSTDSTGYALTNNPTCASDSVSVTVPSCSSIVVLVVDFDTVGNFKITPVTVPSAYTVSKCRFALTKIGDTELDPITTYASQDCNIGTNIDLTSGFVSGTVYEFRYVALDASGNDICESKRKVTASRCTSAPDALITTTLYGWSSGASTVNIGRSNDPYSATSNNCFIETLQYGGVSTYVKTACSTTSFITSVSKPASLTASSQSYSYHVQLHDSSSNILCSTALHTLDNSACATSGSVQISSTGTEYQGDGTFQIALSGITANACEIVAVKYTSAYTSSFVTKSCATNVAFYATDFSSSGITFELGYQFLLRDTNTDDSSIQNCASIITVTPSQCGGGADLGISFDTSGIFTVTPRNVPVSVISCKILMTRYDSDLNLRVKASSTSCTSPVTFSSSDSSSKTFGYGGTFSFLILGYTDSGIQTCTSVSNLITECSVSPNRASVTPQYTGYGDFVVSSTNFPTMDTSQSCQYEITNLAGSSLLVAGKSPITVGCDSNIKGFFFNGVTQGYSLSFDMAKSYLFRRRNIVTNSGSPVCYSADGTFVGAYCQDSTAANTVIQYWHDTVTYFAWVPNPPSDISSKDCIIAITQGSTREEQRASCGTLLGSVASFAASKFTDPKITPLRFSLQIVNADGSQMCTSDSFALRSCSNSGSGASFGVGTDFAGKFYVGISKTEIGYAEGDSCRVEILRINGDLISGSFIQKSISNCDGVTIASSDYSPAVSGAGSVIDFRIVRLNGGNVMCYSPIRTLKYTQCASTRALGWVDSGNLVVTYKDLPDVSDGGTYAGKTCGIETVELSDNLVYKTATCSSPARFTNAAYVADKTFRYHIQITSASPSVISCSTPTYTLTDTTCSGLSGGIAYDDTGIFKLSLSATDTTGPSCEFVYLKQETAGDIAPLQTVSDCQAATFTDTTNFQYEKYFIFKYRRFSGIVESCSVPISVTPAQCTSSTPTTSTLTASHTSTGVFTVALWNHPEYAVGGTCKYYSSEVEKGGSPTCSLNSATIDLSDGYALGRTYKFRFAYFPPSSSVQSCTTSTYTYVDCSTSTRVYGWYSGDGDFALVDSDPPVVTDSTKCRFEFLTYNSILLDATGVLPYVDSSDCSGAKFLRVPGVSFNLGTFSIGSSYTYRLRVVNNAGTVTQCYSAVTSGTASTCTGVSLSLTRFDLPRQFSVAVSGGPDPAVDDCQIALLDYNSVAIGFTSSGTSICAAGSFSYSNAGLAAAPSNGGYYRFGFMRYNSTTGTQTCASPTLAVTDCSFTGDIAIQYNGIGNFVVQSKNPPTAQGTTCVIKLIKYAGSSVSLTSASCGSSSFTQAAVGVTFTLGSDFVFKQDVTLSSGSCVSPEVSVTTTSCKKDSVSTTLSVTWRADGRLIAQVNDPPSSLTASNALISLYSYSGSVLASLSTQTGFDPVTFTIPTGLSFIPGTVSKVLFSVIDGATPASTVCAIEPKEVTFSLCSGGSIELIKYPFSRVLVKPTALSSGTDKCVLRTHGWKPNGDLIDSYTVVSCTDPSVVSAVGYGVFTAVVARFADGVTDYDNTEPICVTPKSSVIISQCNGGTAPISISNPAWNKLQIQYKYDMSQSVCALFVRKWYNYQSVSSSTSVVYFEDTACGDTLTFDILTSQITSQIASNPGFDLSTTYEIEYAAYSSFANAGDSLATSPSCSSVPVIFEPPKTACADSAVTFTRIDGQSVRVNVNCVAVYGYSSISIITYTVISDVSVGTLAESLAKPLQSCTSGLTFDFTYATTNDYPFYTGDVIGFQFNYYGSTALTSIGCSKTYTHTVTAYPASSLPTLQISTNGGLPPYTFTVSKTVPFNGGTCTLTFDCGTGLTGTLPFSSCNTALENQHFYQIVQGLAVPFNTQCTFSYTYVTTQPTVSSALSPTASVNQQITPPGCLTVDPSTITLSLRFTKLESIITTMSGFPDTSDLDTPVCELAMSKWSGDTVSPPVIVNCDPTSGVLAYTFTKPDGLSAFKYSRQSSSSLFGYTVQLREKDSSGFRCISTAVTYYANVCEINSSTLMTVSLVKRPYGSVYAILASVPDSVKSCQIYFYKWKGSSTYTSSVITPCSSTSFDAGALAFDYTTTGFSSLVIGYTSTTPDVSTDTPNCGTKTSTELTPVKCSGVSLTTTVVDYDKVNVKSNTGVDHGSICSFYLYKWNGNDVHSSLVHKETSSCTVGVSFSSSDIGNAPFGYDTDYLFGYAVFSSAAADVLNSNPTCSYEPTQATDGLTATKPVCNPTLLIDWIDIRKATITLPTAPASYGLCVFSVGDGTSNSGLQTCSTSYTYTTGESSIDGLTLSIYYQFYGKSTSVDLTEDVICTSSAQSVTVDAFSCGTNLVKTIATDFTNFKFEIPSFPESLGSCRLVISCSEVANMGEKYVAFTTCSSAINLAYYQISDLFSGALNAAATCSFAYDYFADSSDPNTPFCRSTVVQNVAIQPPDCIGGTSALSTQITTKYSGLGKVFVNVDDAPVTSTGFKCRIRMLKWAGNTVSATTYSVAGCPTTATEFSSYPSRFVFGASYDFVVELYEESSGSLRCRSTTKKTFTSFACSSDAGITSIGLHQLPFSQVRASVTNAPSSVAKCAFYITTWNDAGVNKRSTNLVSCSTSSDLDSPNGVRIMAGTIGVYMVQFSSTSSSVDDQPDCGTDVSNLLTYDCAAVPTTSVTKYGEITLTFTPSVSNRQCIFYVDEWAGDSTSAFLRTYSKVVADCSSGVITSTAIGYASTTFSYDSVYRFEFAQFLTTATIGKDEPSCTGITTTEVSTRPVCSGSLALTRVDGETVSITLSDHPVAYGECQVVITDITAPGADSATSVNVASTIKVCTTGTTFTFSSANIDLVDGAEIKYSYKFFGNTADHDTPTCTSTATGPTTLTHYDIGSLEITETDGPQYAFSLQTPPTDGNCKLAFSCVGGATGTIEFACPTGSEALWFSDINTAVGYVRSGTSCSATVSYYTAKHPYPAAAYSTTSAQTFTLTAPICTNTALTSTYNYQGTAIVTITNPPSTDDSKGCRVTVLAWVGSAVSKKYYNGCTGSISITDVSLAGSGEEPLFRFGSTYDFVVQQYSKADPDVFYCQSSPTTQIEPVLCSTISPTVTASIIKYPFERIKFFASDLPDGYGKCVFYVTQWAGTYGVTRTTNLVDCTAGESISTADTSIPFAYTKQYSVRVSVYPDGSTDKTVEPYCGINPVSVTPALCQYSLTFTNPAYNTVRAVISGDGYSTGSCYFIAKSWDTTDLTTSVWASMTKISSLNCGGVNFVGTSISGGLGFDFGSPYEFEYAEYENPAPTDYAVTNPTCSRSAATYTPPSEQCVSPSSLIVSQNDGQTVSVTIGTPHTYGLCIVELVEFNGVTTSITSTAQACNSKFYFTYSSGGPTYNPGDFVKFKYDWYPDETNSYCSTIHTAPIQLGAALSCQSLNLVYDAPSYAYTFTFDIKPLGGKCLIYFTCDSGTKTGSLQVSDCSRKEVTTLNQLNAYLDDPLTMILGTKSVCSFWYVYSTTTPKLFTCSSTPTDPGVTIQMGSRPCKPSGSSSVFTSTTPVYFADGTWSVTIANPPNPGRFSNAFCRILITRWSGQVVRETYVNCADGGTSPTTLTIPGSVTGPSLVFGEEYSFLVQYVDSTNLLLRYCDCPTRTIVPEVCRVDANPSSSRITLNLMPFPFKSIGASLSNIPFRAGKCNYYLQKWAGTDSSVTTGPVECNRPVALVDDPNTFDWGKVYTAMMIQFPGTDTTVSPLCGLNPQSVTPTKCSAEYTPKMSSKTISSVQVGFPVNAKPAKTNDCYFFVNKWNGISKANPSEIFWKKSTECADVIFTPADIGGSSATYGSEYAFEFGLVTSPGGSLGSSTITCMSDPTTDLIVDPRCDPAKLIYTRVDSNSIRITVSNPLAFTCEVKVLSDGGDTTGSVVTGPCSGNFDFHGSSSYATGNSVTAQFKITSGATIICQSNPEPISFPRLSTYTVAAYSTCADLSVTKTGSSVSPQYRFKITDPVQYHGACELWADCLGTFYSVKSWSDCSTPLTVDFVDINRAVLGGVIPDQSCSFKYVYTSLSGSETCTSSSVTFGPISIPTCTSSGTVSTLNIAFTGSGTPSITVSNPPSLTTSECRVTMTQWNGAISTAYSQKASCSDTFTINPASGSTAFTFGTSYSFQLSIIDQSDSVKSVLCRSEVKSIVPPMCTDQSGVVSRVSLAAIPNGQIRASLSNNPPSSTCEYYVSNWNGGPVTSYKSDLVDCSLSAVLSPGVPFGYTGDYSVRAVAYPTVGSSPSCGTTVLTRRFTACAGSLAITAARIGSVRVTISGEPKTGSRCVVYLKTWKNNPASSLNLFRVSDDCSSVIFDSVNVDNTFEFDTDYAFSYARFGVVKDIKTDDPDCSTDAFSQSLASVSCADSNLAVARPDPFSIILSLKTVPPYGLCQFVVKSSGTATSSLVQSGLCSDKYTFTTTSGVVTLSDSATISVRYSFFPTGVVSGTPKCSGVNDAAFVEKFENCPTLSISSPVVGSYSAQLSSPAPTVGVCQLILQGFNANPINWASCRTPISLTYADILSQVGATTANLPLGSTLTFKYSYYATGSTSDTATCLNVQATNTATAVVPVTVSQTPQSTTSILLSIPSLPSSLSTGAQTCTWIFNGCDGDSSYAFSRSATACTLSQSFTDSHITAGAVCSIRVTVSLDGGSTTAGDSGSLNFLPIGPPAWGSNQLIPTVAGGPSSTCLTVSWERPADNGGSPIQCYRVDQAVGATSDYTIPIVTCSGQSPRKLAPLYVDMCKLSTGIVYKVRISAIAGYGSASIEATDVRLEYLLNAPDSEYTSLGTWPSSPITSSATFPAVVVQSKIGANSDTSTSRVFLSQLVPKSAEVDVAKTLIRPVSSFDANVPPLFSKVLGSSGSGIYTLTAPQGPYTAGSFSLITYSLEAGGLRGIYWLNKDDQSGPADTDRKDAQIKFDRYPTSLMLQDAYQGFYVRWTGFVEPEYSEPYTFTIYADSQARLFVDNKFLIDTFSTGKKCLSGCSVSVQLAGSDRSSLETRKFVSIRLDMRTSGSVDSWITLFWSSLQTPNEAIPSDRLFRSVLIRDSIQDIDIESGGLSASNCVVEFPGVYIAGQPFNVILTAKDAAGNVRKGLLTPDEFGASVDIGGGVTKRFDSQALTGTSDGKYKIPIKIDSENTYTINVYEKPSLTTIGQGKSVTVKAGAAALIPDTDAVLAADSPTTAGSDIMIEFKITDGTGNALSLTDVKWSDIFISAEWSPISDPTPGLVNSGLEEVSLREKRYGSVFRPTQLSYAGSKKFNAKFKLLNQGSYDLSLKYGTNGTPLNKTITGITADPNPVGSSSVVVACDNLDISTLASNPSLTAGQSYVFSIQLRDKYLNAITSVQTATVSIWLQNTGFGTCSASASIAGQYDCTIIPDVAGNDIRLAILVNKFQASVVSTTVVPGSTVLVPGPWMVSVTAGSVTTAFVTGIQSIYQAGAGVVTPIEFRDAEDNVLSSIPSGLKVKGTFTYSGGSEDMPDSFVNDNMDGTFSFSVTCPKVLVAATLTLTLEDVGGSTSSIDISGSPIFVNCRIGPASLAQSSCNYPQNGAAGTSASFSCTVKDSADNFIVYENTYVVTHLVANDSTDYIFMHTKTPADGIFTASGSFPSIPGTYQRYTVIGIRGGLFASFFSNSDFTSVLGTPMTETQPTSTFQYTRIDSSTRMEAIGLDDIGGDQIRSARWTGVLTIPAQDTYNFKIIYKGAFNMYLNEVDGTSIMSVQEQNPDPDNDDTITFSSSQYFSNGRNVLIKLEYIPSGDTQFIVTWNYTTSSTPSLYSAIAPNFFQTPMVKSIVNFNVT